MVLPIFVTSGGELMRIRRASENVQLLSTKTKPKKLDFAPRRRENQRKRFEKR